MRAFSPIVAVPPELICNVRPPASVSTLLSEALPPEATTVVPWSACSPPLQLKVPDTVNTPAPPRTPPDWVRFAVVPAELKLARPPVTSVWPLTLYSPAKLAVPPEIRIVPAAGATDPDRLNVPPAKSMAAPDAAVKAPAPAPAPPPPDRLSTPTLALTVPSLSNGTPTAHGPVPFLVNVPVLCTSCPPPLG